MRINGFEQIKSFYSWCFDNQDKNIKPQHISLYLFLLNQNNRNNWIEWFKCPYDLAMTGSCIGSKRTYYNCLNDLKEWKLINYKKGVNNWKAPVIKLEVLKRTSTVPQSEPVPIQADTPLPIHIYKLITSNYVTVVENLERWISETKKQSEYNSKLFIEDWNTLRTEVLNKPTKLHSLSYNDKETFNELGASREDTRNALKGFFKQQGFPKGQDYTVNPVHFLKYFNTYLQAYHDRNANVWINKE